MTVAASALALAGCSGNTYGTGQTQQEMLLSDINGVVSLGSKKKRISYTGRPKLVPPPKNATLQPPAEKSDAQDAYFPVNPEEARQARKNAVDEAEADGRELGALNVRPDRRRGTKIDRYDMGGSFNPNGAEQFHTADDVARSKANLARKRQLAGTGGLGTAPRRYLTQPPAEYRTPADTAPVGVVGEPVKAPKKVKTK